MFERFSRRHDGSGDAPTPSAGGGTAVQDPPGPQATDTSRATGPAASHVSATVRGPAAAARERQHDEFGGMHWGSAFFGWLVAIGMSTILIALLSAAGAAVGLSATPNQAAGAVGIIGGVLLLIALMVAYYCGGYVAGRMSRFDGGRQGAAVWIIGLLVTIVAAVAGTILGAEFNVLSQLNLPRVPIGEETLATGGLIALAAILVGTLLAAMAGGKAGRRYHHKVDLAGPA